jgi:hypothetical protein
MFAEPSRTHGASFLCGIFMASRASISRFSAFFARRAGNYRRER